MKTFRFISTFLVGLFATIAVGQVPPLINYQGRVVVGTTNFDGTGRFKFALVNNNGTVSFWSNDGTSSAGSEPAASVGLPVVKGLYSVLLGDTTIPGMPTALPITVFTNSDVRLRVWFNDGATGFQQFTPDQRIAAVGYALMGANVPDGAITSSKLANGAVTSSKLASNSVSALHLTSNAVTSASVSNHLSLGHATLSGSLSVFRDDSATPGILVSGGSSLIRMSRGGTPHVELNGGSTGDLRLYDLGGQNTIAIGSDIINGGFVQVNHSNSSARARLEGDITTGSLQLYSTNASLRASLANDATSAALRLYTTNATQRAYLFGSGSGSTLALYQNDNQVGATLDSGINGSALTLYQADGGAGVLVDGDSSGAGLLQIRNTNANNRISLIGQGTNGGGQINLNDATGNLTVDLRAQDSGINGGSLTLKTANGTNTVRLLGQQSATLGANLSLYDIVGRLRASVDAADDGVINLYQVDGSTGVFMDADDAGGGILWLYNTNSQSRVRLDGLGNAGGGQVTLLANDGSTSVNLYGDSGGSGEISVNGPTGTEGVQISGGSSGGSLTLRDETGAATLLMSSSVSAGSYQYLYKGNGDIGVQLDGDNSGAGYIGVYGTNNSIRIALDGQSSGEGRISCDVLQINGGSDLSENFDIRSYHQPLQPGMIVCIDPNNPGQLVTSSKAYDKTVAGVISGAGGVKPGMLMGQKGTAADGSHPVALTGRVYCMVDADADAIEPGDMITTSVTPGHGMKVSDYAKASGAIIGKAMTKLSSGKGLVLVLVSLQ